MSLISKEFRQFWAHEKSLTILLIILAVQIFIIIPLGEQTVFGKIIFLLFFLLLLITGILQFVRNRVIKIIALIVLAIPALLGSNIFFHSASLEISTNITFTIYCFLLGWIVMTRTFSKGQFTFHRIQGAIVVYLLISLMFTMLYHSIYLLEGENTFKGLSLFDRKEFMYFSLTTLTTVGYGDITPATVVTRTLSNLEALTGQLYPSILIAFIVSMVFESSKINKEK